MVPQRFASAPKRQVLSAGVSHGMIGRMRCLDASAATFGLVVTAAVGWSCHSTKSPAVGPATSTSSSAQCPPRGLSGDGQRQASGIEVAGVGLAPPPGGYSPSIDAKTARGVADFLLTGATSVRTVLASVTGPPASPKAVAWTVVGCHVRYVPMGPAGGPGYAMIVAPVDANTGKLIFSVTSGE